MSLDHSEIIQNYDDDRDKEYILEVDAGYPKCLQEDTQWSQVPAWTNEDWNKSRNLSEACMKTITMLPLYEKKCIE